MVLVTYNIVENYPLSLDLVKHKSERKAFTDHMMNNKKFVDDTIFIYDRGLFSNKIINDLCDSGAKFILRIKKNSIPSIAGRQC